MYRCLLFLRGKNGESVAIAVSCGKNVRNRGFTHETRGIFVKPYQFLQWGIGVRRRMRENGNERSYSMENRL